MYAIGTSFADLPCFSFLMTFNSSSLPGASVLILIFFEISLSFEINSGASLNSIGVSMRSLSLKCCEKCSLSLAGSHCFFVLMLRKADDSVFIIGRVFLYLFE